MGVELHCGSDSWRCELPPLPNPKLASDHSAAHGRVVSDSKFMGGATACRERTDNNLIMLLLSPRWKFQQFLRNTLIKRWCASGCLGKRAEGICVTKEHAVGSSSWASVSPHVHSLSNNHLSLNAVLSLAKEGIVCQTVTELCARYQYKGALTKTSRLSL